MRRPGDAVNVERTYRASRGVRISITALLDEAFNIVRRHFALFAGIAAVVLVPLTLLSEVVTSRAVPEYQAHAQRFADIINQMQLRHAVNDAVLTDVFSVWARDSAKLLALTGGFALVQYALIASALVSAASVVYLGQTPTPRSIIRAALKCIPRLLATSCTLVVTLIAIMVVPATLAALAGSGPLAVVLILCSLTVTVFVFVRCAFYAQAVVLEGFGPISAIRRSYRLTAGYFWKTCGMLLLTVVMLALMVGLAGAIVNHASNGNQVARTLVSLLLGAAVMPLVLCAQTLLFIELRVVKDRNQTGRVTTGLETLSDAAASDSTRR